MNGIMRFGSRLVAVVAFAAFAAGCSNWVLGVVQSLAQRTGRKSVPLRGTGTVAAQATTGARLPPRSVNPTGSPWIRLEIFILLTAGTAS